MWVLGLILFIIGLIILVGSAAVFLIKSFFFLAVFSVILILYGLSAAFSISI